MPLNSDHYLGLSILRTWQASWLSRRMTLVAWAQGRLLLFIEWLLKKNKWLDGHIADLLKQHGELLSDSEYCLRRCDQLKKIETSRPEEDDE